MLHWLAFQAPAASMNASNALDRSKVSTGSPSLPSPILMLNKALQSSSLAERSLNLSSSRCLRISSRTRFRSGVCFLLIFILDVAKLAHGPLDRVVGRASSVVAHVF